MIGAPKVFISYSHDTAQHQERVLGLADRLKRDGVDARIDQYEASPPEGWPLWCERQIEAADFVLMVCTDTYHCRVKGDEQPGQGLGALWEARIIRQLLYDAGAVGDKFLPVLFSDGSPDQIPTPIRGWTRYVVDTEDGYEDLYRRLTGQPRPPQPELGPIRKLPTRRRQWSSVRIFEAPPPTECFTGRDQDLEDLRRAFTASGETAMRKLVALIGTAGVGKSQVARSYAYRHRGDYQVVWWITAETETELGQGLIGLARELCLPEFEQADPELIRSALRQWLDRQRDWLLILDNAGPPKTVLSFLPKSGAGHILVTSQLSDWSKVGRKLPIEPWSIEKSIEFLTERTQRSPAGAAALATELGNLPLALEQAAAYVEAAGLDFTSYLDRYQERFAELAGDFKPDDYPNPVLTTWNVSLEAVEHDSPASGDLLRLFAFLASEDIPRTLLGKHATALPQPLAGAVSDRYALDHVVMPLTRYSLINATSDSFALHRLVQAVTMDRMTDTDRAHWANAAIALMDAAFPTECISRVSWPSCARLSPHAEAALKAVMERNLLPGTDDRISRLVDRLARYSNIMGNFNTAIELLKHVIKHKTDFWNQDTSH